MKISCRILLISLMLAGWASAAPPPNDSFGNAQVVTGSVVNVSGTTVEATSSTDGSDTGLDGIESTAPSVFYKWTVPTAVTTASIAVTFNDSTPGECVAIQSIAPAFEPIGGLAQYQALPETPVSRTFVIATTPGQVIWLRVAERPTVSTGGTFTLAIAVNQVRTFPANDRIANAIQLPIGAIATATGSLGGATTDFSEHYEESEDVYKTKTQAAAVWYRWTSPQAAGEYGVSVIGPAAAEVSIFPVATPQITFGNSGGTWNKFLTGAGQSFYIKVTTFLGTEALAVTGTAFTLNIALIPPLNSPQQTATGLSYDLRGATGSETDPGSRLFKGQDVYVSLYSAPGVSTLTEGVWELGAIVPKGLSLTVYRRVTLNPNPVYAVIAHAQNSISTRFTALAGREYIARIAVETPRFTTAADLRGTLVLTRPAASGAPPANDLFANAITIADGGLTITTGNTARASGEVGESFSERGEVVTNDFPNRTLWYRLVPTMGSGPIFFYALDDDNKPLHVRVTTGGLGSFTNEGADAELTDEGVLVSNGTPYYICVDEGTSPARGNFRLFAGRTAFFDNFANAVNISSPTGSVATFSSVNFGATTEPGEPSGVRSLWYKFTATTTNRIYLNTFGSTYDTVVDIYTGTTLNDLTSVISNDDFNFPRNSCSALSFVPVTGTSYHLRLSGFASQKGIATLRIGGQVSAWNPYVLWAMNWPSFFGNPLDDTDRDGLKNLEELAYGGNPLVREAERTTPAGSPVRYVRTGSNLCGITYTPEAPDLIGQGIGQPITVTAQSSPDLVNWSPLATFPAGTAGK